MKLPRSLDNEIENPTFWGLVRDKSYFMKFCSRNTQYYFAPEDGIRWNFKSNLAEVWSIERGNKRAVLRDVWNVNEFVGVC